MKRILSATLFFISLLALTPSAQTADISVYVDGEQVPIAPDITFIYSYQDEYGESFLTNYYMDVPPQINAGRVFVPLRMAANYWDAEVFWHNPDILLNFGETSLTLTVGGTTALKNETGLSLEAAPYIMEGRVMAPLRFISEAFGCEVNYTGGNVYITTPSLYINDKKVVALQEWAGMTNGGWLTECKTNICINKMYWFLKNSCGNEISAPEYFGTNFNLDVHTFYYMDWEISFMVSDGTEGEAIQKFRIYHRTNDDQTWENPILQGIDFGKWLIYDVTQDKWYQVTAEKWARYSGEVINADDFLRYLSEISDIGQWNIILDAVAIFSSGA